MADTDIKISQLAEEFAPDSADYFPIVKANGTGNRRLKLTNLPITKAQVGLGNADNTSDAAKPISTSTQAALDSKADASSLSAHVADVANPHGVTKAQVGLGNADNTSDAAKPISVATQAALDGKAPTAHTHAIGDVAGLQTALDVKASASDLAAHVADLANPHDVTASQVGAYTATQADALLAAKADASSLSAHVADVANPHGVTKAQVGLGNADNTSDAAKPISAATQAALDGKAPTAHTHAIGDVAGLQTALDGKAPTAHTHAAADVVSGVLAPARLGSGTPAAGTYVDGGTGAWTALPSGGGGTGSGMAIGDPVASGTAKSVLFVDPSGNLGQDPTHLTYDAATGELRYTETTTLAGPKVVHAIQSNLGLTSANKFDAAALRYGYAADADGPVVASLRFGTSGGQRGELSLYSAGDINGADMIQSLKCDEFGDVIIYHGLQYKATTPIRLGLTNADNPTARLQVCPDGVTNKGLILQRNTHYADSQLSLMEVQDQDVGAVTGGIDNGQRWYIGSPSNLGAMLSVQARATAEPAVMVQAIASQTADLLTCTDSTGAPKSGISAGGYVRSVVGSGAPSSTPPVGSTYLDDANSQFYVYTSSGWKKATLA